MDRGECELSSHETTTAQAATENCQRNQTKMLPYFKSRNNMILLFPYVSPQKFFVDFVD